MDDPDSQAESQIKLEANCSSIGRDSAATSYGNAPIGAYARYGLLLISVPLLLWLFWLASQGSVSVLSLVAATILSLSLLFAKGPAWLRSFLILAMALNVLASVINPEDVFTGRDTSPFKTPNLILLVCLAVASIFELRALIRQSTRKSVNKALSWSLLAIPAVVYAVGIPVFDSIWDSFYTDEAQLAKRDPNWTLVREMSFRVAKFAVFAWFTYIGACIGSFLNVVASCVPRGKSVILRDSICPKCNQKIKRIDNIPVFSYINLSGKCRSCSAPIPARYLIVELAVAWIFGSLFLFELVTGAANVPSARVLTHKGILWVIMYPKWDVIGLYTFHIAFMSMVLVLSLIEIDRQKLKWHLSSILLIVFALPAIAFFPIQPLPVPEFVAAFAGQTVWLNQLLKVLLGGVVGALVGLACSFALSKETVSTLVPAMILTGVVLGWQSTIHVSGMFLCIVFISRWIPKVNATLTRQPTTALLVAIILHHPFWKLIYDRLAF